MKLETQSSYIANPQFVGGVVVTPSTGATFNSVTGSFGFVAGGLYVGGQGNLVVRTYDASVLTFVSASGFIPGLISAVSSSSTATNIIALK
jgi:hypothetical protein